MTVYVALALIGAALIAIGVAMWAVPAGLVVGGGEILAGAYAGAYIQMRRGVKK